MRNHNIFKIIATDKEVSFTYKMLGLKSIINPMIKAKEYKWKAKHLPIFLE